MIKIYIGTPLWNVLEVKSSTFTPGRAFTNKHEWEQRLKSRCQKPMAVSEKESLSTLSITVAWA